MTREESINKLVNARYADEFQGDEELTTAHLMAINALEQESCEDCVSRQAVDELSSGLVHTTRDKADFLCNFWEGLRKLPSVTPTRKTGEWCKQNDDYYDWYECSECGYGSNGEMQYSSEYDVRTKYCPNCGAEMEVE